MKIIQIKDLSVSYDKDLVLENLNLDIYKGDLIALIGPNGAGKSTLIKSILQFLKPLKGSIKIENEDYKLHQKEIAYIPQKSSVDWDFPTTLFDVVLMGAYGELGFFKRVKQEHKERALEVLKEVELLEFKDRQISELSGGQQQRAFLARALMQKANIYLLDEPFQGVDAKSEKSIINLLKKLRDENKTIIVVHHDLQTVSEYFDKVALINKNLIAIGNVEDVFTKENIELTYRKVGFLDE